MDKHVENARLAVEAEAAPAGGFEVMAITAGEGNGWRFSAAALRESLPLWDGVEVFIDHAQGAAGRSVRDLAGVLARPRWDDARQGVRCALRLVGPSAPLLAEMGQELVALRAGPAGIADPGGSTEPAGSTELAGSAEPAGSAGPRVGFSADLLFTAEGRAVSKILRVLSVDLVFNPARGGAFLRALNSAGAVAASNPFNSLRSQTMPEEPTPVESYTEEDRLALRAHLCGSLLESSLAAARLPQPAAERLRAQFTGRVFAPSELTQAIEAARALVSDLTGPAAVAGMSQVRGMYSSEDQFTAALYDLLGARRPEGLAGLHAARLSGIRELYTLMTGDTAFTGGCDPTRASFSTSADLPAVLKNAMNRLIVQEWEELGRSGYRWWEPLVTVEHFTNLHSITGVLVGEITTLPAVNEGAAYAALPVSDSAETAAWAKYGGYVGLSLEMFERDETHRLRQYPRKLAAAGLRRVSALVGTIFTANNGMGPNLADGQPVFGAARGNLGSAALSPATWEAASAAIYNQPMLVAEGGSAPKMALDAKYLVVPRGLRLTARQILYPSWEREAGILSENLQRGEPGDVITCPEFADANDWAAAADPRLAPGIVVAERFGLLPEIIIADAAQNGALFTNDEIRIKARHWLAVFVADPRALYKAVVG